MERRKVNKGITVFISLFTLEVNITTTKECDTKKLHYLQCVSGKYARISFLHLTGEGTMAPISSISVAAHANQKEGIEKDAAEKLENATSSIPQPIALPTNISRLAK